MQGGVDKACIDGDSEELSEEQTSDPQCLSPEKDTDTEKKSC